MQRISYFLKRGLGKQVCYYFPLAFIVFFAFSTAAAAENLVEQRWREQNAALSALEQSTAKTAAAQQVLDQVYVDLAETSVLLAEGDTAYNSVLERYYDVLGALEEQRKQRILAKAAPQFLIVTRDALRAQWIAFTPTQSTAEKVYREHLQIAFRNYTAAVHAVNEAISEGNRRIANEINPEIERLVILRANIIQELDGLSQIEYDTNLTTEWFMAAQNLYEAEQHQISDTRALDESTAAFIVASGNASPPFLQSIKVTTAGQIFYDFSWIREGYEDDVTASIEYAQRRDSIADNLPRYTEILRSITFERALAQGDRHQLALQMRTLSAELVELGDEHFSLEYNQILATMFAEMGIAVAEAVLTGGIATAVRRGEEIAEKALLEATIGNKQLASDIEAYAAGRVSERLVQAVDDAGRAQFDRLVGALNAQRAAYVKFEIEEAVLVALRNQNKPFTSFRDVQQNMLPGTVNRLVREAAPAVESRADRLFQDIEFESFEIARLSREILNDQGEILSGSMTALAGKYPDLYEAYSAHDQRILIHNAQTTDVGEIFRSQAVEWAIGTGIDTGFEVKNLLANPADLSGIRTVGRQAVVSAAFSAVEGLTKTYISQLYEREIIEIEAKYWSTFMQLAVLQQYYYHLTLLDAELAETENWYRDVLNKMTAVVAEIGLPRHAGGAMPEAQIIPSDIETIKIALSFSTPLIVAPIVSLEDMRVPVSGGGKHWSTTITITDAMREAGSLGLHVGLGNGGASQYVSLDRDPATIAYIPINQLEWSGYEYGSDSRHVIKFENPAEEAPVFTGRIISLSYPQAFISDGPKAAILIMVSGEFAFPVVATLSPRSCPSGFSCGTEIRVFDGISSTGTLNMAEALWCSGATTSWFLDYQVQIEDANNQKSNAALLRSTCAGN